MTSENDYTVNLLNEVKGVDNFTDIPSFALNGYLTKKFDPVYKTDTFCYQEFIVTVYGQKQQDYKLMCVNTRIPQLLKVNEGDLIEVAFNLLGRKFESDQEVKYSHLTAQAYEINLIHRP